MFKRPLYGNGFINVPSKGEAFDAENRQPSSYTPEETPNSLPKDKMFFLIVSNFLPLSAGETLHKKKILQLSITDKHVPPNSPIRLNTRAFIRLILNSIILKRIFL